MTRHWIYIDPATYYGWLDSHLETTGRPTWHWSHDANSYGEEGRALCGRLFSGSPIVSRWTPAEDQYICPECRESLEGMVPEVLLPERLEKGFVRKFLDWFKRKI